MNSLSPWKKRKQEDRVDLAKACTDPIPYKVSLRFINLDPNLLRVETIYTLRGTCITTLVLHI